MNIEEYARSVGVELLPWQRETAARIEQGVTTMIPRPGKSTTFEDIVREWEAKWRS